MGVMVGVAVTGSHHDGKSQLFAHTFEKYGVPIDSGHNLQAVAAGADEVAVEKMIGDIVIRHRLGGRCTNRGRDLRIGGSHADFLSGRVIRFSLYEGQGFGGITLYVPAHYGSHIILQVNDTVGVNNAVLG